jgi:tetratricopeptide (TPR) repeat protein
MASKKRKSAAQVQQELRDLAKPTGERPPVDMNKLYLRAGGILAVGWVLAAIVTSYAHVRWPLYVALGATVLVAAAGVWMIRYVKKSEALGAILRGADTNEGRKEALKKLETDFKRGDVQATMARAQLEMQDDPRKALETLESIDLKKQMTPVADQVRALRASVHLSLGEAQKARSLADQLELGKQQEPKTRAMFAAVAGEAWARTGNGKKALEILDIFDADADDMTEMRIQILRARAFAYASTGDMKGAERTLKKLADTNINLLAMFVGKKIHPLLERSAKNILMRSGAVPRKMVTKRM